MEQRILLAGDNLHFPYGVGKLGHEETKEIQAVQIVYCSPESQCIEAARMIFPKTPAILLDGLLSMNLGKFSGQAPDSIAHNQEFQKWAASPALRALGGGEEPYSFRARCTVTFQQIVKEMERKKLSTAAVFTHRLVIEMILQRFHIPRACYRDWSLQKNQIYIIRYDTVLGTAKLYKKVEFPEKTWEKGIDII